MAPFSFPSLPAMNGHNVRQFDTLPQPSIPNGNRAFTTSSYNGVTRTAMPQHLTSNPAVTPISFPASRLPMGNISEAATGCWAGVQTNSGGGDGYIHLNEFPQRSQYSQETITAIQNQPITNTDLHGMPITAIPSYSMSSNQFASTPGLSAANMPHFPEAQTTQYGGGGQMIDPYKNLYEHATQLPSPWDSSLMAQPGGRWAPSSSQQLLVNNSPAAGGQFPALNGYNLQPLEAANTYIPGQQMTQPLYNADVHMQSLRGNVPSVAPVPDRYRCPRCGLCFPTGRSFGGHMSSHSKARMKAAKEAASNGAEQNDPRPLPQNAGHKRRVRGTQASVGQRGQSTPPHSPSSSGVEQAVQQVNVKKARVSAVQADRVVEDGLRYDPTTNIPGVWRSVPVAAVARPGRTLTS